MNKLLTLTANEAATFAKLAPAIRADWKVEAEVLKSYETPAQIAMRMHMSSLKKYPFFKTLAESVEAGKPIDGETLC